MKRCFCDFCNNEVERTRSGDTNTITLHMGSTDPEQDRPWDVCNSCVLKVVDMFENSDTRLFTTRFIKQTIEKYQF